jgi:hypothetical protein
MRRVLIVLLVALVALVVAPSAVTQQPDVMPFPCEAVATGEAFGTVHIVGDVQAGIIPEEHTPGMHRGFAQCVP